MLDSKGGGMGAMAGGEGRSSRSRGDDAVESAGPSGGGAAQRDEFDDDVPF